MVRLIMGKDKKTAAPDPVVHEVDACYSIAPGYGLRHVPTLLCSCGARAHGDTWEEAGAEFDTHLPKRTKV